MHAKQNGLEIVEVIPKEDLAMACKQCWMMFWGAKEKQYKK